MKTTNLLMIVAIVAVAVALVNLAITIDRIGDIKALTGYAAVTATANLTVQGAANIIFNVSNISWGSGYVTEPAIYAEMDTQGTMINGTDWATISQGLWLQNNGNADVTVNISSDKDADGFIGGTGADNLFQWNVSNYEILTCGDGGTNNATNITSYIDANTTTTLACWNMSFVNANDILEIDLKIRVPSDALSGAKGDIITATATAI